MSREIRRSAGPLRDHSTSWRAGVDQDGTDTITLDDGLAGAWGRPALAFRAADPITDFARRGKN